MHKLLRLQHHRHTGRRLQHHHTSYRALFVVLAVLGISLLLINKADAETLDVTATIDAPVATTPAAITTTPPPDNTYAATPTEFVGDCPTTTPSQIVMLWRDGQMIGSTPCQGDGHFDLSVTLVLGINRIVPRVINITGQNGPDGDVIIIYYYPPVPPSVPTLQPAATAHSSPTVTIAKPPTLTLSPDDYFLNYTPGKEVETSLDIEGGTGPYKLSIDWGDGRHETLDQATDGKVYLQHTYSDNKPYNVTINVQDAAGQSYKIGLGAVSLRKTLPVFGTTLPSEPAAGAFGQTFRMTMAIYTLSSLVVLLFWIHAHPSRRLIPVHVHAHHPPKRRRRH